MPPASELSGAAWLRAKMARSSSKLAVSCGSAGQHTAPGEGQHPADVGGVHEVPSGAENMNPRTEPAATTLSIPDAVALGYGANGAPIVLRLDGARMSDHLGWSVDAWVGQVLVEEPAFCDVHPGKWLGVGPERDTNQQVAGYVSRMSRRRIIFKRTSPSGATWVQSRGSSRVCRQKGWDDRSVCGKSTVPSLTHVRCATGRIGADQSRGGGCL